MAVTKPQVKANHAGARWVRAALQVNPYDYVGKASPSKSFPDETTYNAALLDECLRLHIELIAITDHWSVDTALKLASDAAARGIVALPGFEANSSEGVHLLVIFEEGTKPATINAAIGVCGGDPGQGSKTGKPYAEILETMAELGALVIPAHANVAKSGMLTGRAGLPLIEMVQHKDLHAIGITPSVAEASDQKAIFGRRVPFTRKHPIARVHADDICNPSTLSLEGATTWFKMSKPGLKGLMHAVHIPPTRVSVKDPSPGPRGIIREVSWEGGFLHGVTVALSDDMTNFIGGRGTGKSTIIESLRYVLGVEPLGAEATKDHNGIVKDVLGAGTTVRLAIDAVSPTNDRYTIQRTVFGDSIVLDSSDTPTQLKPEDVIGRVEIYGQHELAELAQDKMRVAEMLRRFSPPSAAHEARKELLEQLEENRNKFERAEEDRAKLDDELADLDRLQDQVDLFKNTDVAKRLAELKRLQQDEAVFKEGADRVAEADDVVADLVAGDILTTLASDIDLITGSAEETLLRRVTTASKELGVAIETASTTLQAAIVKASAEIAAAKAEWSTATSSKKDGHDEVLRQLRDEGAEPEKYLTVSGQLEALKTKAARVPASDKLLKDLGKARAALLRKLAVNDADVTKHLSDLIRDANNATSKAINVRSVQSPDRAHITKVIQANISGHRSQIVAAIEDPTFSMSQFVAAARSGEGKLDSQFHIKGAQAASLISAGEPLFRKLEELTVEQAVDVYLDTSIGAGPATFRRLDQLSKGQRATALLMLLLGASTSPLIIDQPEDDLDNRFVFREIVKKLRSLKGKRQIIASTHNANIPVLGDAEVIVVLEGDGSTAWIAKDGIGSLDNPTVLGFAEELLEGGRDAFGDRQHLYGF